MFKRATASDSSNQTWRMSILGALNPQESRAEQQRKLDALTQGIAARHGITPELLLAALAEDKSRKRLNYTQREVSGMAQRGIRK